jgi:hypothetical protein
VDDLSNPLGIVLLAVGIFVAVKTVKTVIKIVMLTVVLAGLYLLFGVDGGAPALA